MASLFDDVSELLEAAMQEPVEGLTLWSFHVKDHPRPLDEDEIVAKIESGAGVFALELVYDADLELFQRGTGRKVKSHAELVKLKRERFEAMHAAPLPPRTGPLVAPVAPDGKRTTPLHGAFLSAPSSARSKAAAKGSRKRS